jgi:transcriptional regulator with XRE-family HTH domain
MFDDVPEEVGKRVARARKNKDVTQLGLARRTKYSRSHIAKVEAGDKIPTSAFIVAVATALSEDPAWIYGQPYRTNGNEDRVHSVIPAFHRVIAYAYAGPDLDGPARPLDVLADEIVAACRLTSEAQFTELAQRLPTVVEELNYWVWDADDPRAWALLSRGYSNAVGLVRRLGYFGDALALLELATQAARQSEDPNLPHLVTLARARVLMSIGLYSIALTLLDRARANLDIDRPDGPELAGAIDLCSALVAARAARGDKRGGGQAWDYLGQAEERVKAGRMGSPVHQLEFTPANLALHGAAIAAELDDLDEATRRDASITGPILAALPPERRTRHDIDMSRVLVELGEPAKAEERITNADRLAPQMVTLHPTARAVVAHLVELRRRLPEPLGNLHHRMGTWI